MPRLSRERDGAGDSGPLLQQLRYNEESGVEFRCPSSPQDLEIGWSVRVGSISGRTYSSQDYWTTTPITEILETTENSVRFKTGNSIYILED